MFVYECYINGKSENIGDISGVTALRDNPALTEVCHVIGKNDYQIYNYLFFVTSNDYLPATEKRINLIRLDHVLKGEYFNIEVKNGFKCGLKRKQ